MSEVVAQKKFSCPACGGESVWTPGKQALICPYCGTTSPLSPASVEAGGSPGQIVEHDLVEALRRIPDEARGYQLERRQVKCQSCQAVSLFSAEKSSQSCEFCGSTALVPFEEAKEAFRPESLLPMKLSESSVRESIRTWYGSHFFAPSALGAKAMTDRVKGLYVPYWTFDARAHADWTAMSGDYYYETERYRDSQGQEQTRQVQRVRWYPTSGSLDHFFDDDLVAATRGLDTELLPQIEPYPTGELVPYDTSYLSGWTVERYQIDLVSAAEHSRQQMLEQLRQLCSRQVPGDTHRDLDVSASFVEQRFKHILVPVWILSYQYHGKTFQVLVNGVTGRIAGRYPISGWKVFFTVLAVLALVLTLLYFANSR